MRDDAWFFDTELLCSPSARDCGSTRCRSTGSTTRTRASTSCARRSTTCAGSPACWPPRGSPRFLAIGVASTIAYALLFLALRASLGPAGANAAALAVTAVANTQANRRLTFGLRGRRNLLRQHAMGAVVYVLTLGLTSGALLVLHAIDAAPSRVVELAVLVLASACATVTRFVALRSWVFARRARRAVTPAVTAIARVGT